LHDHVFLLRRDYLLTKTSLTPPQFINVPVQSHERERVRGIIFTSFPTIIRFWNCSEGMAYFEEGETVHWP
jgi:hypothetical protein